MTRITSSVIEQYLLDLLPASDEVLREMEAEARKRYINVVGAAVGRFLFQLAQIAGAKTVFELGSGIGYSTLWWARAVGEGGRVIFTDGNRHNAEDARRYFQRAGVAANVEVRVGDALELLSEEKGTFDIIFNDVDKEDYPRAFRLALPRLRRGSLFVTDNVLWYGQVAEPAKANDAATRGVREFNKLLYESKELYTTIVPLRDGVAVARKL